MTELNFKGKESIYNHHLVVPFCELKADASKSVGADSGNLIIHGDNLKALKALIPQYAGKVDVIYIDPPYNTGKEGWCYNDNVSAPGIKEWLNKTVGEDDLLRHDKWCCMMWPRIRLLHELLADNGVIFISIDDKEHSRLRLMMDEIFGEENGLPSLIWHKKKGGGQNTKIYSVEHEYIVVYRKCESFTWQDEVVARDIREFKKTDDSGNVYKQVPLVGWGMHGRIQNSPTKYFSVKDPDGNDYFPVGPDGSKRTWRPGKDRVNELMDAGLVDWEKKSGRWVPYERIYPEHQPTKTIKTRSILDKVGQTGDGTTALEEVMGKADLFPFPKPHTLIEALIKCGDGKDAIILDSFAGSGTTAHAVLEANKADGGNRRFILVEMEGYADSITAERVRKIISGYTHNGKQIEGLDEGFTYYTLGEDIELDKLLAGKNLPSYEEFAPIVFHMVTSTTLDTKRVRAKDYYLGEAHGRHIWFLYAPDKKKLLSGELALTLDIAKKIASNGGKHIVISPVKFVSQDLLKQHVLDIEFVPLPFGVFRL